MFEEIKKWLRSHQIQFKEIHHQPTLTSEQSAKVRGEDLSTGGKALVMKVGKEYKIFVISASRKVDSAAIKKYFGVKKLRFVNPDELKELTGLVPGSVPPFGKPFIQLDLFIDESITQNEIIAFNAASLEDSLILRVSDYLKVVQGTVFSFSK